MYHMLLLTTILACLLSTSAARLAGECAMMCNDLRYDVLTMEMCRDAKRTLPRPKVGDFCSTAMEQGFSDACVALCMDQRPVARVAQTCRAAAIEMPRPTVRRWCEHGYNVAFQKTVQDLASHFTSDGGNDGTQSGPSVHVAGGATSKAAAQAEAERAQAAASAAAVAAEQAAAAARAAEEEARRPKAVVTTIPITIEDEEKELVVYEGQNAEEAVVAFCRENVPADVSACIRQLLSTVIEKMEELGVSSA